MINNLIRCHACDLIELESSTHALLSKELEGKTRELRQLQGEDLEGLDIEELKKLEKLIRGGLSRVFKMKVEKFEKELNALKKKEIRLMETNTRLKQQAQTKMANSEQGHSSESFNNNGSSGAPPQEYDSSDTSLKLG
ncbi:hypothetical protein NMG60_11019032 [Bertholletia excelsa]